MPTLSRAAARSRKPANSFAGTSEFRSRSFYASAFSAALPAYFAWTLVPGGALQSGNTFPETVMTR